MTEAGAFLSIFLSAFLAATILPAQSEIGLGYLILYTDHSFGLLIVFASLGNTLGAVVNWLIGCRLAKSVTKLEKIQASPSFQRMIRWYQKFGQWTLLLSWLPIIGDPITVIAGIFKIPFKKFLLFVAFAKTSRYLVIAFLAENFSFVS